MEHAPAVGSRAQGGVDFVLVRLAGQHGAGPALAPAPNAGAGVGDVDLLRVVGARVLAGAAVQAARGRPLGGVFRLEVVQGAEALYLEAGRPGQPAQYVHVVAALLQDHGAGLAGIAPVAPHEAVGLVPVGHVLDGVNGLDFADLPPAEQVLQDGVKFGVAQHVAHHHRPPSLPGLFLEGAALPQVGGDGLFQQDVVALVQGLQGGGDVLPVLGGHDHHVGQLWLGQQRLVGGEAHPGGHAEALLQQLQPLGAHVRPGDDFHFLRVGELVGGVGLQPPGPAAADGKGDRL